MKGMNVEARWRPWRCRKLISQWEAIAHMLELPCVCHPAFGIEGIGPDEVLPWSERECV